MGSSEGTGFSGFSRVEGVSSAPIRLTLWHPTILTVKYFGLMGDTRLTAPTGLLRIPVR